MLRIKEVVIWIVERILEIFAGSVVALAIFGSNFSYRFPGVIGDLWLNFIYVLFFFVVSGYVVSAFYFGLIRRSRRPEVQAAFMTVIFLAHFTVFAILSAAIDFRTAVGIGSLGALCVAIVNYFGARVLR